MKIKHVQFDIPETEHRKLKLLSIRRGCTLKSMLQEAVHNYIMDAPEQSGNSIKSDAQPQERTMREVCDTVFYLSRYAEALEIDQAITVPDERELFHLIYEWARDFRQTFDPGGGADYQAELETRGPRWLLETFPHMPELDGRRQAIIDFIKFEEETSVIWPWAVPAEGIIQSEEMLLAVEKLVNFDDAHNYDTDELYAAVVQIAGVNPALETEQGTDNGMTMHGI